MHPAPKISIIRLPADPLQGTESPEHQEKFRIRRLTEARVPFEFSTCLKNLATLIVLDIPAIRLGIELRYEIAKRLLPKAPKQTVHPSRCARNNGQAFAVRRHP